MRKYEVTLKSGRKITVEGSVHLYDESSDVILNKNIDNHFNSREVQSTIAIKDKA